MIKDEDHAADDARPPTANDNGEAQPRIDATILRIARLIGRLTMGQASSLAADTVELARPCW